MVSITKAKAGLFAAVLAGSLAASAIVIAAQPPGPPAGAPGAGAPGGGPPRQALDPRVQQRTYVFEETKEEVPYAVFVSSKVSKDKKNPLIIALHGLGGDQNTMLRGGALDKAEEGGYILVGPMGCNASGWYGAPASMANGACGASAGGMGGPPRGAGAPPGGAPRGAGGPPGAGGPAGGPPRGAGGPPGAGGPGRGAAAMPTTLGVSNEVSQRSEKDVMTVLDMIRKEFNVDENRIYIYGHSMGGAGALYLGVKHASIWAGIGAIAPAHAPAGIFASNYSLAPAKHIPVMIVQGTKDPLIPLDGIRQWVDHMRELDMTYKYMEFGGGDHGTVMANATDIIEFFNQHKKQ